MLLGAFIGDATERGIAYRDHKSCDETKIAVHPINLEWRGNKIIANGKR